MKCVKCEEKMSLLTVGDNLHKGYAFNLFRCDDCDMIMKDEVWKNPGQIWIDTDNVITRVQK